VEAALRKKAEAGDVSAARELREWIRASVGGASINEDILRALTREGRQVLRGMLGNPELQASLAAQLSASQPAGHEGRVQHVRPDGRGGSHGFGVLATVVLPVVLVVLPSRPVAESFTRPSTRANRGSARQLMDAWSLRRRWKGVSIIVFVEQDYIRTKLKEGSGTAYAGRRQW
jgi:hypothetical protein